MDMAFGKTGLTTTLPDGFNYKVQDNHGGTNSAFVYITTRFSFGQTAAQLGDRALQIAFEVQHDRFHQAGAGARLGGIGDGALNLRRRGGRRGLWLRGPGRLHFARLFVLAGGA